MREIKFRGISTEDHETDIDGIQKGEWVYGLLPFRATISTQLIGDACGVEGCSGLVTTFIEVKPETIGQYTGLKDKNGKEVYEGDILQIHGALDKHDPYNGLYEPQMEVIYCDSWAAFGFTDEGAFLRFRGEHRYEIIGNVFENPELLK